MTRFTCVVLAGGPHDALAMCSPDAPNKAFISIAGRTLVARTIDALRSSPRIGRIITVAPESTHTSSALANADERRTDGPRITDSLRSGLRNLPPDELTIIAASDLPILTRAAVDDFIMQAEGTGADIIYACVERSAHLARFPEIPHTWGHLREGVYCGAGLTALRPRVFVSLEHFLERLGAARKNPLALASIFGLRILALYALRKLGITEAEARATHLLGACVRAVVCSHPEIAVNIDRIHDIALAENLLYSRCQQETAE